jgi:N-acetylgalactosamine kinase
VPPVKVSQWLRGLNEDFSNGLRREFKRIYGSDEKIIGERRDAYVKALNQFGKIFGFDAEVIIARAPGRVNIMGRHVDYMGGSVNPMATDTEIIALIQTRDDDRVILHNMDPEFKAKAFRIGHKLPEEKIRDLNHWDRWTAKKFKEKEARGEALDWDEYVKGLVVYLQDYFRDLDGNFTKRLKGMNLLIGNNLPSRRGLSSSSALVVSIAVGMKEINEIEMPLGEFIDRIGYSEWYRFTRGASADHAAIMLSRRGHISHISSLPTRAQEVTYAPFPEDYRVIIVSSGFERPQDEETRNYLRVTAAAYRLALLLIKNSYPEYVEKLEWLRDVTISNLGVGLVTIYEILKSLPEVIDRKELRSRLAERYHLELEIIFANHREPRDGYKLRQMALYGLAEAERAVVFPKFLRRGDVKGMLELIRWSHDGDRVAKFDREGQQILWDAKIFSSDERLGELIALLRGRASTPSQIESAQLYWQPGGYERSIAPIDYMCDIVSYNLADYAAAQIVGAGLGGDVEIIIHKDKIEELRRVLTEEYCKHYEIELAMTIIFPGQGACLIRPP